MVSPALMVAVETTSSIRTSCMSRTTGFMRTFGTGLGESRHGPLSSGGCDSGGCGRHLGDGDSEHGEDEGCSCKHEAAVRWNADIPA